MLWPLSPALQAQTAPTTVVGDHEPPAVKKLLLQASQLEAGSDADSLWLAATRYCEASRMGSTEAQYRLGMFYAFGQGVPSNKAWAASLFSLAATQGHAQASFMLDEIQARSTDLPTCVVSAAKPEKAPAPDPEPALQTDYAGLGLKLSRPSNPDIDRYLRGLPVHKQWLVPLATTLSSWYKLDPKLVLSVMAVESNLEVKALSSKEAMGLMQLIPGTAERFNVKDAFDATQNMRGGMRYLRYLLSYYRGNIVYALAAYNAGEGRVDRYKGVPPFPETHSYVKRVVALYGELTHSFDAALATAPTWIEPRLP